MQNPQPLDWNILHKLLPPRQKDTSKADFGHVLVIGGNKGMAGAAHLAGEAALRVGAGLVSVATRPEHVAAIVSQRPELMVRGVETLAELEPLLARATVLAIGPGLGKDVWAQMLWKHALACNLPKIIDADALNLLALQDGSVKIDLSNAILTPHPGEAARLLSCSTTEIQADRQKAAQLLQQQYGGVVVLKGAGTLIQAPGAPSYICLAGNPGMASGGMGDVLTGVLAGLVAQKLQLADAAYFGVLLHAMAGDAVSEFAGERGLLASDLLVKIRELVNI